jgi:hypothetical protein
MLIRLDLVWQEWMKNTDSDPHREGPSWTDHPFLNTQKENPFGWRIFMEHGPNKTEQIQKISTSWVKPHVIVL